MGQTMAKLGGAKRKQQIKELEASFWPFSVAK